MKESKKTDRTRKKMFIDQVIQCCKMSRLRRLQCCRCQKNLRCSFLGGFLWFMGGFESQPRHKSSSLFRFRQKKIHCFRPARYVTVAKVWPAHTRAFRRPLWWDRLVSLYNFIMEKIIGPMIKLKCHG